MDANIIIAIALGVVALVALVKANRIRRSVGPKHEGRSAETIRRMAISMAWDALATAMISLIFYVLIGVSEGVVVFLALTVIAAIASIMLYVGAIQIGYHETRVAELRQQIAEMERLSSGETE